jgi:hypothetical protein
MEKINELFECAIGDAVNQTYPSLYTKDDVVSLLSNLRTTVLVEVSELKEELDSGSRYTWENIDRAVNDLLDGYAFDEFIECEPELCGSYGGSYSLEMNQSFDEYQFRKSFVQELEDYFKPNTEE